MGELSNKARLETAFKLAEKALGIPRLLDSEDVDVDKPDEKSVMTYVASFLNKYPEPGTSAVPVSRGRLCMKLIDLKESLFTIIYLITPNHYLNFLI